jgi:hypothetical protein
MKCGRRKKCTKEPHLWMKCILELGVTTKRIDIRIRNKEAEKE